MRNFLPMAIAAVTLLVTGSMATPAAAQSGSAGPCFDNTNRYVDCGNGTVTDTVTGLIWLQQADCLDARDWAAANQGAAALHDGVCSLADGSVPGDWRLPTIPEWQATIARADALACRFGDAPSLTNDAGTACYTVGPSSLTGVVPGFYWSSTANEEIPSNAWLVNLAFGGVLASDKGGRFGRVWAVRGGPR